MNPFFPADVDDATMLALALQELGGPEQFRAYCRAIALGVSRQVEDELTSRPGNDLRERLAAFAPVERRHFLEVSALDWIRARSCAQPVMRLPEGVTAQGREYFVWRNDSGLPAEDAPSFRSMIAALLFLCVQDGNAEHEEEEQRLRHES